ncbi:MAG: hypothetical protein MZV70_14820 [Desulfobacterales bacterium]|nr:hypothetical protein [Desulfobacterales bacterium]
MTAAALGAGLVTALVAAGAAAGAAAFSLLIWLVACCGAATFCGVGGLTKRFDKPKERPVTGRWLEWSFCPLEYLRFHYLLDGVVTAGMQGITAQNSFCPQI